MGTVIGLILVGCAISFVTCVAVLTAKLVGIWDMSHDIMKAAMKEMKRMEEEDTLGDYPN